MSKPTLVDRYRGALVGLAVGDALGTTVEFKRHGTFDPVTDMVGGGPFRLRPGQWTDDTSMALCLAESLVECGGFDARDQMEWYVRWWREGHLSSTGRCFDIGNTTRTALASFERSGNPFSGPTDRHSAGNGSLMRLAPVPLFFVEDPREAIRLAGESSRTTHGTVVAIDACRYFAGLLIGCLQTRSKEEILEPRFTPVDGLWDEKPLALEIDDVAAGSYKDKSIDDIRSSGYAVHTLEAALWAFHTTSNFDDGALAAVNLGDDADTVGAVYGQIAGAFYCYDAIRPDWRARLADKELIENLSERLYQDRYQNPQAGSNT